MMIEQKIKGIVTPIVTPLLSNDKIDETGTVRLVNHLIDGGVSAIFALGTTGEAPSLSNRLKKDFLILFSFQEKFWNINIPCSSF